MTVVDLTDPDAVCGSTFRGEVHTAVVGTIGSAVNRNQQRIRRTPSPHKGHVEPQFEKVVGWGCLVQLLQVIAGAILSAQLVGSARKACQAGTAESRQTHRGGKVDLSNLNKLRDTCVWLRRTHPDELGTML